jgi:predicted secreted protein
MLKLLTMAVIILAICSVGAFSLSSVGKYFDNKSHEPKEINSFEECANSGFTVINSNPPQCTDSSGKIFTRQVLD